MARAHVVLGIVGGILGILMSPLSFVVSIVVVIFSTQAGSVLILLTGIGFIMAIVGLVGAIFSRRKTKPGSLLMLVSGIVPLLVSGVALASLNVLGAMIPLLVLYFWTFILIFAGAIGLTRKSVGMTSQPSLTSTEGPVSP